MRTHRDIIRDAGGVTSFAKRTGLTRRPTTVQSWWQRDSIPGEYWLIIAQLELASLPELALAAATRRQRPRADAA
jgi:hypothetical protein